MRRSIFWRESCITSTTYEHHSMQVGLWQWYAGQRRIAVPLASMHRLSTDESACFSKIDLWPDRPAGEHQLVSGCRHSFDPVPLSPPTIARHQDRPLK